MYRHQPYGFKTCLLGRGFHIPIKNTSFSSPTDVGSNNPPPWGPASLLVHRSVSGSNAICNSLRSPLAGIINFGPLRIVVSLTVLKCVGERCFHITLRNVSFSFSTDVRSHSPWKLLKNLWEYLNRRIRIYNSKRGKGLLLILCVDNFIKYKVNFIRYD